MSDQIALDELLDRFQVARTKEEFRLLAYDALALLRHDNPSARRWRDLVSNLTLSLDERYP
jgi:hypothetical protein